MPVPTCSSVWSGEDEDEDGTFDFTWSQTNSSSATSSRESGEGEAYLCIVSMSVVMYLRFASVLLSPFCCFHASLRQAVSIHTVQTCKSRAYHFSRARFSSSDEVPGRSMMPSTSPSGAC